MQPAARRDVPLSEADFARLQRMIEQRSGIFVTSPALLVQRLTRRLRDLELDTFGAYCARLTHDADEQTHMLECICTHETRFFREPQQLQFFETVCHGWHARADQGSRERALRVWSAGCASGEEPYTLAMILRAHLPAWRVEILASDLSSCALGRVDAATWPIARASEIPDTYLRRFMLQGTGTQDGWMRAAPELQALVRSQRINLVEPDGPPEGHFDAVFCRNVLIYFREPFRTRVLERLLRHLTPGGYLFLGHAEGLGAHSHDVRAVGPIVYQSAAQGAR